MLITIGARPTGLDRAWQDRLALEAYRLGTLWQLLGYYGRCSFDAILVDARDSDCRLHWVECNGRWGGTSIPMTLANRLGTNWGDGFLVVDEHRDIPGLEAGFAGFLATNGDELFVPEQRPRGLVVLAPGRLDQGKGFEFLLLGHDPAEGQKKANRIIARLSARPAGT